MLETLSLRENLVVVFVPLSAAVRLPRLERRTAPTRSPRLVLRGCTRRVRRRLGHSSRPPVGSTHRRDGGSDGSNARDLGEARGAVGGRDVTGNEAAPRLYRQRQCRHASRIRAGRARQREPVLLSAGIAIHANLNPGAHGAGHRGREPRRIRLGVARSRQRCVRDRLRTRNATRRGNPSHLRPSAVDEILRRRICWSWPDKTWKRP